VRRREELVEESRTECGTVKESLFVGDANGDILFASPHGKSAPRVGRN